MSRPYFSVVIPTRNRSFLIGYAIRSILRQSFADWEMVIVDNDDDPDATARVVRAFADPRIRLIRTGGLSMPDNWDAAVSSARGEYLVLIEDKMVARKHALDRVAGITRSGRHTVVTWGLEFLYDLGPIPLMDRYSYSGALTVLPAADIVRRLLTSRFMYPTVLKYVPLADLSAVHRSVIEKVRQGPLGRLCPPISPDITSALQILALEKEIACLDESLVVVGSCRHSMGGEFVKASAEAKRFNAELGGDFGIHFSDVPIKAFTGYNSIYNDYVRVRSRIGGNLTEHPIEKPEYLANYFVQCWGDVVMYRFLGADTAAVEKEWETALSRQPAEVRGMVAAGVRADRLAQRWQRSRAGQAWKVLRQFPRRLVFENALDYIAYCERPRVGGFFVPEILYGIGLKGMVRVHVD